MASVWIARQTGKHGFQKLVAIKTDPAEVRRRRRASSSMFLDEARIASRIEHANVAQILDVGEQHGVTYLVMEYVDGDALSKISRAARKKDVEHPARHPAARHGRRVRRAARRARAAGTTRAGRSASSTATSRRRTCSSARAGVAKLIDFGIAKARDRLSGDTNAGHAQGQGPVHGARAGARHGRSTGAPTSGPSAPCSTTCSRASRRSRARTTSRRSSSSRAGGRPCRCRPPSLRPCVGWSSGRSSHSPEGRFATAAELQQALEEAIVEARLAASPGGGRGVPRGAWWAIARRSGRRRSRSA